MPIPVVLSFVYLSQQSTLLQCTPIVSILYRIFMHISRIHITCTHLYSARNRIFCTKKFLKSSIGIGTAVANSIGYRAPARYQSNPTKNLTALEQYRLCLIRSTFHLHKNSQNCCNQTRFLGSKYTENAFAAEALTRTRWGSL